VIQGENRAKRIETVVSTGSGNSNLMTIDDRKIGKSGKLNDTIFAKKKHVYFRESLNNIL